MKKLVLTFPALFLLLSGLYASANKEDVLLSLRKELTSQENRLREIKKQLEEARKKQQHSALSLKTLHNENARLMEKNKKAAQHAEEMKTKLEQINLDLQKKEEDTRKKYCMAEQAKQKAQEAEKRAICIARYAEYHRCEAEKAGREAKGAIAGAVLATVTGGSSILLTGAGYIAGRSGEQCENPSCMESLRTQQSTTQRDCTQTTKTPLRLFAPPPRQINTTPQP